MTELTTLQARDLIVSTVNLEPDGSLQITYLRPEQDVYESGVINTHTLYIPWGDDYDEELMIVLGALRHLVLDVLDDLPRMNERRRPPPEPDEDE